MYFLQQLMRNKFYEALGHCKIGRGAFVMEALVAFVYFY
jgi:hypothetical protein